MKDIFRKKYIRIIIPAIAIFFVAGIVFSLNKYRKEPPGSYAVVDIEPAKEIAIAELKEGADEELSLGVEMGEAIVGNDEFFEDFEKAAALQEAGLSEEKEKEMIFSEDASFFKIAGGRNPHILNAIIDPLDVRPGDTQKMILKIKDDLPVMEVIAEIEHDLGKDTVVLELVSGTVLEGEWYGEWNVHDTHDETYRTRFIAINEGGDENAVTMAWTDACSAPISGNWTLSGSCSITADSEITGAEAGNIDLNGNTLTISGGAIIWNSGYSVSINGGTISISHSGSTTRMKKADLFMKDDDEDGYPPTTQQYYGTDADSAYPAGCSSSTCRRRNALTSHTTTDCYDSNASAKSGQTSYFTVNRGDGSFDYNCDSVQTKLYPTKCNSLTACNATYCGGSNRWFESAVPACGATATLFNGSSCPEVTQSCR